MTRIREDVSLLRLLLRRKWQNVFFYVLGREYVYAKRSKYGGYFPQCENRWNEKLCLKQCGEKILCDECENTKWIKLDVKKIIALL